MKSLSPEDTPLQKETHALVRRLAVGRCGALPGRDHRLRIVTRNDWMGGLLSGLTLAMAILAERISHGAGDLSLARGLAPLQKTRAHPTHVGGGNLGRRHGLCAWTKPAPSPKTGWSSTRSLPIDKTHRLGTAPIPSIFHTLIDFGLLASQPNPVDPMEQAIERVHRPETGMPPRTHPEWTRVHEYPAVPRSPGHVQPLDLSRRKPGVRRRQGRP
jgi:Ca2+-transporting ATPase